MGVSRDTLDRIKSRLDTLEIIREAVPSLKQSGPRWKGNCPFHNEKTPSFFYMPDKGLWHCFGACNEGGDVFRFVMKTQNQANLPPRQIEPSRGRQAVPAVVPRPAQHGHRAPGASKGLRRHRPDAGGRRAPSRKITKAHLRIDSASLLHLRNREVESVHFFALQILIHIHFVEF
jgi:hypothetical protein